LHNPRSAQEYARVLETLLEEATRLSDLAERLLFLCRQDAGLHPAGREEVVADELLRETVGTMLPLAQEKGVHLAIGANVPCRLTSDGRRLRRVLYNLLDNAIKYTQPGGEVTVSGQRHDGSWVLSVADTGAGIAPEHLPHVFERFYRVDAARSGDGGAGLGL